jgi:hypothetical protein
MNPVLGAIFVVVLSDVQKTSLGGRVGRAGTFREHSSRGDIVRCPQVTLLPDSSDGNSESWGGNLESPVKSVDWSPIRHDIGVNIAP